MTQLVLDGIVMPECIGGGYTAGKQQLSVDLEMITGRLVREVRGSVWVVTYQYGFFDDDMKQKVIAACEKGQRTPIVCGFLTPTSTKELNYSSFFVTEFTYPKFMWSRKQTADGQPIPLWADFSVTLREVRPSD